MKKRKKELYPGTAESRKEAQKSGKWYEPDEQPDFIGGAPNYDKFDGWNPEEVLSWLNID